MWHELYLPIVYIVSQAYGVMMKIPTSNTCDYKAYKWVLFLPDFSGILWLHVVLTCPPPPHVHSQMPPSVNSSHPDMTVYQVMTVEKHITLTSYWVMYMITKGRDQRPKRKVYSLNVFTNVAY